MGFNDVEQRMRARHADVAATIPELDNELDEGESEARYRAAKRAHAWKVMAGGVVALAFGALQLFANRGDASVFRGGFLAFVGIVGLITGPVMLYNHRPHKLPRAQARKVAGGSGASREAAFPPSEKP